MDAAHPADGRSVRASGRRPARALFRRCPLHRAGLGHEETGPVRMSKGIELLDRKADDGAGVSASSREYLYGARWRLAPRAGCARREEYSVRAGGRATRFVVPCWVTRRAIPLALVARQP